MRGPLLSAAQMQVVEHGSSDIEFAEPDFPVTIRTRTEHPAYSSTEGTAEEHNTSAGYCEVYQLTAPLAEKRGAYLWFALRTTSGMGSRSVGYETREIALARLMADVGGTRRFWRELAAFVGPDLDREGRQIIRCKGQHYTAGSGNSEVRGGGFGGSRWEFKMHDGRTFVSRDLWSQGRIPTDLAHLLPDNAVQVPFEEWSNR